MERLGVVGEAVKEASSFVSRTGQGLPSSIIQELKNAVNCEIVVEGEVPTEVYAAAVDRWNKAYVKEAAIIVNVKSEDDIAAVLKFVQKYDIGMTIAAGRHSFYGASSIERGLVIDLKNLNKVSIDKEAMTVTAGSGCRARDLEVPAYAEGLSVVMGAVHDTGIGGLSLGGGSGYLSGQYGYVVDNILSMRVVLADGSIHETSIDTNPELFWALRGGGSNFGVVTEFTYRAHKQGQVYFGPLIYTDDKISQVLAALEPMQQVAIESNGRLATFFAFMNIPGTTDFGAGCLLFYDGPEAEARDLAKPLFDLEPMVMASMMDYPETTKPSGGDDLPAPYNRVVTSNAIIATIDKDIIAETVVDFREYMKKHGVTVSGSRMIIEVRSHEVSGKPELEEMAFAGRSKGIVLVVESQYAGAENDAIIQDEVRELVGKFRERMAAKHKDNEGSGAALYNANLANVKDGAEKIFGGNLPKLRELKRKYDPNFIFNKWHPISPA